MVNSVSIKEFCCVASARKFAEAGQGPVSVLIGSDNALTFLRSPFYGEWFAVPPGRVTFEHFLPEAIAVGQLSVEIGLTVWR